MSIHELFDVLFRWAHFVAGIMWVGNSMLFNWLDRNLEKDRDDLKPLSQGKIFMVHSGAFYEAEKMLLAPGKLPKNLHWFKWQNGITWMTGICLFVIVYYMNGAAFLVDPSRHGTSPIVGVTMSISSIFVGYLIYDTIWRVFGEGNERLATILSIALLFGSMYAFAAFFSGRGAYLQTGVLIGTVMTGNVWFCILPSQKELIASTQSGRAQDPKISLRAKQRSIHNNYLTFPLLFIMISSHFPAASGAYLNWVVLIAVMVGGSGVRHFMNVRYKGDNKQLPVGAWVTPAIVMGSIAVVGMLTITRVAAPPSVYPDHPVAFSRVQEIIGERCLQCHSVKPTDKDFHSAPLGVMFDKPGQIQVMSPRIKYRAYEIGSMPFNNRTNITDAERGELARWVDDGANTN